MKSHGISRAEKPAGLEGWSVERMAESALQGCDGWGKVQMALVNLHFCSFYHQNKRMAPLLDLHSSPFLIVSKLFSERCCFESQEIGTRAAIKHLLRRF